MEKELLEKTRKVMELKKSIENEYVTKASKDIVDESLVEARVIPNELSPILYSNYRKN